MSKKKKKTDTKNKIKKSGNNVSETKTKFINSDSKRVTTLYLVLRILVVIVMIRQVFLGEWNNVFLCILTLILFLVPVFIERKINIALPDALEIIILLFIFSAEILGEINEYYLKIDNWDTILHTINGFLCAAIGFALIDILNQKEFSYMHLSPVLVALVAFSFSMTIGVMWEFFEYGMDVTFKTDMQKDTIVREISTVNLEPTGRNIPVQVKSIDETIIKSKDENGNDKEIIIENGFLDIGVHDTMKDLIVNFIGAVAFSIIGLLYIEDRDKYKFAENFIPVLKRRREKKN